MIANPVSEGGAFTAHDLTLVRLVQARREVVWRLWSESRHLAQWWGPYGFTNPECSIDPRAGGALRILMRSPTGEEFLNIGTVQVANAPECLAFTIALLNQDGSRRLENLTIVRLTDRGTATEMTVQVRVLRATPDARENLAGMRAGWTGSLETLAQLTHEGDTQ